MGDSWAIAFETSQLPLSESLQKSFPKIKASCFIISNKKSGIIVNEKNSKFRIHSGSFNDIVFELAKADFCEKTKGFDEAKIMNDYAKRVGGKDSVFFDVSSCNVENKTTLYDMCCIFENFNSKNICFFKSAMSGVGCGFHFKNHNDCEFSIVLYGLSTKEEAIEDIKSISSWLDQFFEYRVSKKGETFAKIPVFYGKSKIVDIFLSDDHFLLLSKNLNDKIMKISRYRTMLHAPVDLNYQIGVIFYQTSVFQNPITKVVLSEKKVQKSCRFKTVLDSVFYVIFGSSFCDSFNKEIEN